MSFSTHGWVSISPTHLRTFEHLLKLEGFSSAGIFQFWKAGQVFGYVKNLGNGMEWHVRGFKTGELDSEIEPSRLTRQHLTHPPTPFLEPLMHLLGKYGLLQFRGWPSWPTLPYTVGWPQRPRNFP